MNDEQFEELVASVRQAGAIRRGEAQPARLFKIDPLDIKQIRGQMKLSQSQFAALLGISVGTLRGWEQGRRKPEGPARVLLLVAARRPDVIVEVLRSQLSQV